MQKTVLLTEAKAARERIAPFVTSTALQLSEPLSSRTGKNIWLKLENQQLTGSFKIRPALNGILCHLAQARNQGVITTSSGNYAQAVAYAAKLLGVHATIVMTPSTATIKIEKTKAHGARVVFCEDHFESRFETLERIQKQEGQLVLHGFDSSETIAGNGTIALELVDQLKVPFSLFSPASGGGLVSGIAGTLKALDPVYEIFGAQPEVGGAIVRSLARGSPVNVGPFKTIADALVASVPGARTFPIIQAHCANFFGVTEESITHCFENLLSAGEIGPLEPGGAVSVAAMLEHFNSCLHRDIVCVISGGNFTRSL
ncbi:MAG TPA: threonine/serine dehydratase [Oligoflexia bacterium]|nr:threonine/serine dehydratase [Oligoflexia bacterium]